MSALGVMVSGGLGLAMAAASIIADDLLSRAALVALRTLGLLLIAGALAI